MPEPDAAAEATSPDIKNDEAESSKKSERAPSHQSMNEIEGTPGESDDQRLALASSARKTGSAKSTISASSHKSQKASKKSKKSKGKAKKEEVDVASTVDVAKEEGAIPDGCQPLFLASKTQEIFGCTGDEDVTKDNPVKILKKEDILQDIFNRAAVSDFTPIKQVINDFPEDEIVIVYDYDYKYGQNFYIALTPESKNLILNPPSSVSEAGDVEEVEEEEAQVYEYVPPVSKPWISLGSEVEVDEESMKNTREKVCMSIKRTRREFGTPINFVDRNVGDAKDSYIECTAFEDKSYDLHRIELDKAIQAIPIHSESSAQTDWKYPRNAAQQYEARTFDEEEKENLINSNNLKNFCEAVYPRFELAMQQNDIMDVFYDDWLALSADDSNFGSKADSHLKEYQSFTDLQYSKDKSVTAVEWHPTIKGVIAVSVVEKMTFDERVDNAAKIIMSPSLILIWSFADPIHPQLLLEAPDDIYCFKFSPTDPNIIAGGCINGQVVLWDITGHQDKLKTQRGANKKKNNLTGLPGFEDETPDTPIIRYCAVSSIEHSHRAPITDIQWVPDHLELNRMGIPLENTSGNCVQLMTCATDHSILVWDTRPPKGGQSHLLQNKKERELQMMNNPMGTPTTFKHLDLTWKPHLKINLTKSEPGGDHSPVKFCMREIQGNKSILRDDEKASDGKPLDVSYGSKSTVGQKKPLTKVNTHLFVGTEDGEVVYVDWMPQKDQDSGKIQTPKPDYYHSIHDAPISTVQRSPFFRDVILVVGGWTFTIWKEGVTSGPILMSSASNKRLTTGYWSPTRPAVFYIAKEDGSIDIWDLVDRTHEPFMSQNLSPSAISAIYPHPVSKTFKTGALSKQHLLAIGDVTGTLHILEIPWSLRVQSPGEYNAISNYIEREVNRRTFVMERWNFREREKMEIEAEAKRKAGIAPAVQLSEEEMDMKAKAEYNAFMEEEDKFLRDLGLKEDPEEQLPVID